MGTVTSGVKETVVGSECCAPELIPKQPREPPLTDRRGEIAGRRALRCPACGGATVIRHGRDDTLEQRQRYRCKDCRATTTKPTNRSANATPSVSALLPLPSKRTA